MNWTCNKCGAGPAVDQYGNIKMSKKNAPYCSQFCWNKDNNQGQGGNYQYKPTQPNDIQRHITIGQSWNVAMMSLTEAEKGTTLNWDEVERRAKEAYVRLNNWHNPKPKEQVVSPQQPTMNPNSNTGYGYDPGPQEPTGRDPWA